MSLIKSVVFALTALLIASPISCTTPQEAAATPTCSLSEDALTERLSEIGVVVQEHCRDIQELPDGFAFHFQGGNLAHDQMIEIARKEKICCPSVTWDIDTPDDDGSFSVRILGDKEFVREHLVALRDD